MNTYTFLAFVIGMAIAASYLAFILTHQPKFCLQYFDGIKPVYNLGCILEEADRRYQ